MKTWVRILATGCFVCIYANNIELELQSPESQSVLPGKVVTAAFFIKNRSDAKEFISSIQLPEGWHIISFDDPSFILGNEESTLQCIAIKVPQSAIAGTYQLCYSVEGATDVPIEGKADFIVDVPPCSKLQMFVERPPNYLTTTMPYEFQVLLSNKGNVKISADLFIKDNLDYSIEYPSKVVLQPSESKEVKIKVKTPYLLEKPEKHYISIKAKIEGEEKEPIYEMVETEIFPGTAPKLEKYRTLAMKTVFGYGMRAEKKQVFIDQYGSGTLDEEKKRHLDLFFRLPFLQQSNVDLDLNGIQERYYLHYWDPFADAYGGYGIYKMTPLLMNSRFAKGGSLALTPGPVRISGLFIQDTSSVPQQIYGGDVSYRYKEYLTLTASSMNTTYPKKSEAILLAKHSSTTNSLFGNVRYKQKTDTTLEYATIGSPFNAPQNKSAYYFYSYGSPFKGVWYGLQKIHADPNFVGYYRDTDQLYASLGFPIVKRLRGVVAYNQYKSNLYRELNGRTASRNFTYYGGLSSSFPFGLYSSLYYNNMQSYDALNKIGYRTQYLSLTGAQTFSKATLQGMIDYGRYHSTGITPEIKRDWQTFQLNAYYQVTPNQQYSVYTRLGYNLFSSQIEWTQIYGASANCHLFKCFDVNLVYEKTLQKNNRNYLNANLVYTLPNKHQLALKGYWDQWSNQSHKIEFLVSYTVPWNLPIARNRSRGAVQGTLSFEDSAVSASNIIVSCDGQRTLTNESGQFTINNLTPGDHLLHVEERAGALIPLTPLPMEVSIKGGDIIQPMIRFEHPATLQGHVELYDFINDALEQQGSWHKVKAILESATHKEKLFTSSDADGVFHFDKIPPGRWILKLYVDDLPPYHYIENKEILIDIFPGDEKNVEARLLPVKRKVRIIDSGELSERRE